MTIIINNKQAVLKKGSTFEFVSENRFFTDADAYSFSITFPLKGCPRNQDIFGHINRKDHDLDRLLLDCEIHDRNFHAVGSVSIVSITEVEVKTQFLEGRSARNFHSDLDDIFINNIQMPSLHFEARKSFAHYCRTYDEQIRDEYLGFVGLPWVNNSSGNIQNPLMTNGNRSGLVYQTAGGDFPVIVGQPFLLEVLKRVLEECAYSYNINILEDSQWSNVIICNAFPLAWEMEEMNLILPHWTASEFLHQLELLFDGQFNFDNRTRKMTFEFNHTLLSNMKVVQLESVVNEHSVEVSSEEEAEDIYQEQRNLEYAECNHQLWKYYSCPWATKGILSIKRWDNILAMKSALDGLLDCAGSYSNQYYNRLHYCRAEDTYFVLKCVGTYSQKNVIHHKMQYQPVNVFGPRIINTTENAESTELKIVPACIDSTDATHGDMIFIECGTLGDAETADDKDLNQTKVVNTLAIGEKEKKEEYFDKLYVAYWEGNTQQYYPLYPHPIVDRYDVLPSNDILTHSFSMRLTGSQTPAKRAVKHRIDQTKRFIFSFLADSIPDVRSIFMIHGKKYLAEKISCSFSENGMSSLLKMTCYRMTT